PDEADLGRAGGAACQVPLEPLERGRVDLSRRLLRRRFKSLVTGDHAPTSSRRSSPPFSPSSLSPTAPPVAAPRRRRSPRTAWKNAAFAVPTEISITSATSVNFRPS